MIKRLIFDFDDTLIKWEDKFNKVVNYSLDELNFKYNEDLCDRINDLEYEYEKKILPKCYKRTDLTNYLNEKLKIKLPENFVNIWIKNVVKYCVPEKVDKQIYELLEYLSKKYELVILTSWFTESQIGRLKRLDLQKYFNEVYGPEDVMKPYKESFIKAMGNRSSEECAMIGDDLKVDIKGAQDAGINKVVWKDNYNKKDKIKEQLNGVNVIKDLKELENIF